jgi:hypothetical protein
VAEVRNFYTGPITEIGPLFTYLLTTGIDGEGSAA